MTTVVLLGLLLATPIVAFVLWLMRKLREQQRRQRATGFGEGEDHAPRPHGTGEARRGISLRAAARETEQPNVRIDDEPVKAVPSKAPPTRGAVGPEDSADVPAGGRGSETAVGRSGLATVSQLEDAVVPCEEESDGQAGTSEHGATSAPDTATQADESLSEEVGEADQKNGMQDEEACGRVIVGTQRVALHPDQPRHAERSREAGSEEDEVRAGANGERAAAPAPSPDRDDQEEPVVSGTLVPDTPRKYGGLVRKPPQPRNTGTPSPESGPWRVERSLPIEVRLHVERDGFCAVSLIARRSPGMAEQVTVTGPGGSLDLVQIQDDWYQDIVPVDIARVLREGTVWTVGDDYGPSRWSLSGRQLYVLAAGTALAGWVSQPSLQLGRQHVVLCTEGLRRTVEEALQAAGAAPDAVLDSSRGAPSGWVVLTGVVPARAVKPAAAADILNALRPIPEIDISLEGGIRLEYATWLAGFPPAIRVYGDPDHTSEVLIDGQVAEAGADGIYRAAGWDTEGTHTAWCRATSKSYSLTPFTASWSLWDAHSFPVASGSAQRLSVCGPLVHDPSGGANAYTLQVPDTHPVVLGAAPGEFRLAVRGSAVRGAPCLVSVAFGPVWALPHAPLRSSGGTRILLVGQLMQPTAPAVKIRELSRRAAVQRWCQLILDASRKGLLTEPGGESVRALWLAYKDLARRIWRARRR